MKKRLLVLALSLALTSAVSMATPVIYESFDYAAGSLEGQNGGSGWGGAWTFSDYTQGTQQVVAEGLTFSNYHTSGGALRLDEDNAGGSFRSVGVRRAIGVDFAIGSDVWVSFLAKSAEPLSSFTSMTAEIRHGATAGATELRMRPKGAGSQGVMIAYDSAGSNVASKSAQDGRTYLYVCRFGDIASATGKVAIMWVLDEEGYNLSMADGVLSEADLNANYYLMAQDAHTNQSLNTTDSALINLGDSNTLPFAYYFDEIRYGTSLDAVLIPEPATIALLGLGGLLIKRRK